MVENERKDDNTGDSGGKSPKKLRVLLRTFGCQMNERDSEIICGILSKAGYKIADSDQEAEIIIFNTCSVRKHAEDRVWSLIGMYKGKKIIGLVGCMAQNYKERAFGRNADVDFVVGPQDIAKLPEILNRIGNNSLLERKIWETETPVRPEEIYHTGYYQNKHHAYVVISEGCSNFCSYCVVPYVRGGLRHRKAKEILGEVEQAAKSGISEITLLGQNVNAYNDADIDFAGLLERINGLCGLKRISFFTSHPKDTNQTLFEAINKLDKLEKTLHLPLQSASDRILKLMNRGYSAKEYFDLIQNYRKIVIGGAMSTDIIVGFPTETEEDFEETYKFMKKAEFNAAYIFKYSPRPNTEAARMADNVTKEDKESRHKKILDLQRGLSKNLKKHAHAKN